MPPSFTKIPPTQDASESLAEDPTRATLTTALVTSPLPWEDPHDLKHDLSHWLSLLEPILKKYLDEHHDPKTLVVQTIPPEILMDRLKLSDVPCTMDRLIELIQLTLDYSVRTGHPLFLDKLYAGATPVGMAAELLTAVLNANTHVRHVAPVATCMETVCLESLLDLAGYPRPTGRSCGLLCPGGAMSNLVAMCTARNHRFPAIQEEGMAAAPDLVVLTSQHAHFSIDKAAMVLGIGRSHVLAVECNELGQMLPSDLETKMQLAKSKGWLPFFIAATSGTTVLCAFDPLREIAEIAHRHQCWLHVDGSYGGSFIFDPALKTKYLDGLELSHSFVLNPHKLLGVPLQCSCLLLALPAADVAAANAAGATGYLYHGALEAGTLGLGCGRRADAVKLYLCWQSEGRAGFAARAARAMATAHAARAWLRGLPGIATVPSMGLRLCFRHPRYPTRTLRTALAGRAMVDYASLPGVPDFFRVPVHPHTQLTHLQALVREIVRLGDAMASETGSHVA